MLLRPSREAASAWYFDGIALQWRAFESALYPLFPDWVVRRGDRAQPPLGERVSLCAIDQNPFRTTVVQRATYTTVGLA